MMKKQIYPCLITILTAILLALPAQAAESPSLLQIMQQLGRDLNRISDGLWREDYAAVAAAAQAIADHPQPPVEERTRIIGGLGADAGRFRQGDQNVHDAALAIKAAAEQEDSERVLQHYIGLVEGCMNCHTQFRERVRNLTAD